MRLIDADALEADLKRQYAEVFGNARKTVNPNDFYIERVAAYNANAVEAEQKGFFEYLKTRPTVNVVFCKDCKWWTKQKDSPQGRCVLNRTYPTGGWYCANGRRE